MAAKEVEVEYPAEIFGLEPNIALMHQVVVAQEAAARQGTHKAKRRGEVSGSGRKPFRQKGTGRARQGSIRAPQMKGGGVAHPPTPRDYHQRTPKKMKAAALREALSNRKQCGALHVVDSFFDADHLAPSTKGAREVLAKLFGYEEGGKRRVLVVLSRQEKLAVLSLQNLQLVHVLYPDQLNTYDVLHADDVVFTQPAFEGFVHARGSQHEEEAHE